MRGQILDLLPLSYGHPRPSFPSPQDKLIIDGMTIAQWKEVQNCVTRFYRTRGNGDVPLPRQDVGLHPPTKEIFRKARA